MKKNIKDIDYSNIKIIEKFIDINEVSVYMEIVINKSKLTIEGHYHTGDGYESLTIDGEDLAYFCEENGYDYDKLKDFIVDTVNDEIYPPKKHEKGGEIKPRLKKGDIVEISANKWRDVNGNTYHNVQVYVNDNYIGESGMTYGYGDHYEQTAREMIFDKYKAPYSYNASNPIYMLKNKGVKVVSNSYQVNRKRDMLSFAKGGEVKKKGTEMIMGGLAGVLLGIFLNK
jgi:hypothetical protein|tara:strand:- start:173 stop:856 length:684 start_codon:yes stop_codon:yes gene_type:complete